MATIDKRDDDANASAVDSGGGVCRGPFARRSRPIRQHMYSPGQQVAGGRKTAGGRVREHVRRGRKATDGGHMENEQRARNEWRRRTMTDRWRPADCGRVDDACGRRRMRHEQRSKTPATRTRAGWTRCGAHIRPAESTVMMYHLPPPLFRGNYNNVSSGTRARVSPPHPPLAAVPKFHTWNWLAGAGWMTGARRTKGRTHRLHLPPPLSINEEDSSSATRGKGIDGSTQTTAHGWQPSRRMDD